IRRLARAPAAGRPASSEREDVDGSTSPPQAPEAVADGVCRDLAGPARRLLELEAPCEERRDRGGVRAAGPVRGAGRIARTLDPEGAGSVVEHVGSLGPVPPGDDHGAGAQ